MYDQTPMMVGFIGVLLGFVVMLILAGIIFFLNKRNAKKTTRQNNETSNWKTELLFYCHGFLCHGNYTS